MCSALLCPLVLQMRHTSRLYGRHRHVSKLQVLLRAMQLDHLAQYYKQEELSDVTLLIRLHTVDGEQEDEERPAKRVRHAAELAAAVEDQVLAKFPAHRLVLFGTDYFKTQAQQAWAAAAANINTPGCDAAASASSSRPSLHLPIESEQQLPAAEAVIAALYDVPDALSSLQQQQLVDAAVIADRLGAPRVAQHAVDALQAAAEQAEGQELSAAALDALASLPAWPACLQPLLLPVVQHASCCDATLADLAAITAADTGSRVQGMLLAVLGDLEAVWMDDQLLQLLMALPLPALQLLLSSDQLRVASEDTVLYTASQYATAQHSSARPEVRTALALLVRAPHLSRLVLASQALSSGRTLLLSSLAAPLKMLVSFKLLTASEDITADALDKTPGAPASWRRDTRQRVATDGVRMVWRLPVEQVAQACRDSFAGNKTVSLHSRVCTPPLGGFTWMLQVQCKSVRLNGVAGVTVGLFLDSSSSKRDIFRMYSGTLACSDLISKTVPHKWPQLYGRGFSDFFKVGIMSAGGGWDEAAWAAKGLPTSGELELSLHMHSVS